MHVPEPYEEVEYDRNVGGVWRAQIVKGPADQILAFIADKFAKAV
jgi:hypothetical protein